MRKIKKVSKKVISIGWKGKIYFIGAMLSALIFLYFKKQPWEYITAFNVGLFLGNTFRSKQKTIFFISIIFYSFALVFDPIFKPILDSFFKVDTVLSSPQSLLVNTLALLLFWIGFYVGKK